MKSKILAVVILAFGLLTLFLTSSIIFDCFNLREKEGNYVLVVVWGNFLASLLYISGAIGLLKRQAWPKYLLMLALLILIIAYLGLWIHIRESGLYETKTIYAMGFRTGVTALFLYLTKKLYS